MNFCRKCGTSLAADSIFCHHCGASVAIEIRESLNSIDELNSEDNHSDLATVSPFFSEKSPLFKCICGEEVFEQIGYSWFPGTAIMKCNKCGMAIIDELNPEENLPNQAETGRPHDQAEKSYEANRKFDQSGKPLQKAKMQLFMVVMFVGLSVFAVFKYTHSDPTTPQEKQVSTTALHTGSGHWISKCRKQYIETNHNPQNVTEAMNSGFWVESCTDVWVTNQRRSVNCSSSQNGPQSVKAGWQIQDRSYQISLPTEHEICECMTCARCGASDTVNQSDLHGSGGWKQFVLRAKLSPSQWILNYE